MITSGWNLLCCVTVMVSAALPAFSVESYVPLMPQLPTLDGKVVAEEWSNAAGFDGFAWEGQLERRHIRAFVGATEDYLCLAFVSQLPEEGQLTAQIQKDTLKLVYDDSVEIWIDPTPGSEHGSSFQMLANSLGCQAYEMHARGNLQADPDGTATGRSLMASMMATGIVRYWYQWRVSPQAGRWMKVFGALISVAIGNSPGHFLPWMVKAMLRRICSLYLLATQFRQLPMSIVQIPSQVILTRFLS